MSHTEAQQARTLVQEVKERLIALVDQRPYVFKETLRADATRYLDHQKQFRGLTEAQIGQLAQSLNVTFPTVFRVFLQEMGAHHGDLFCGSATSYKQYKEFREWADELLVEDEVDSFLSEDDLIFLFHQGYTFCFFKATAGYDAPVFQYAEGQGQPRQIATGFTGLLEGELQMMEQLNADLNERGGYFVILSSGGMCKQQHPSLNSGIRPLEIGDVYLD